MEQRLPNPAEHEAGLAIILAALRVVTPDLLVTPEEYEAGLPPKQRGKGLTSPFASLENGKAVRTGWQARLVKALVERGAFGKGNAALSPLNRALHARARLGMNLLRGLELIVAEEGKALPEAEVALLRRSHADSRRDAALASSGDRRKSGLRRSAEELRAAMDQCLVLLRESKSPSSAARETGLSYTTACRLQIAHAIPRTRKVRKDKKPKPE